MLKKISKNILLIFGCVFIFYIASIPFKIFLSFLSGYFLTAVVGFILTLKLKTEKKGLILCIIPLLFVVVVTIMGLLLYRFNFSISLSLGLYAFSSFAIGYLIADIVLIIIKNKLEKE